MSHLSNLQSTVGQFEAMTSPTTERKEAETTQIREQEPEPQVPPLVLQNIEDWEMEHKALEAQLRAEIKPGNKTKVTIDPLPKKQKKVTNPEDTKAEEIAMEEMGSTNWVGKLQMYRDARPVPGGNGIDWDEGTVIDPLPRFTCAVLIHETIHWFGDEVIGSRVVSFSDKKKAKRFAAKKAVDWLIENEYMARDGSVPRKPVPAPLSKKMNAGVISPQPEPPQVVAPVTSSTGSAKAKVQSPPEADAPMTYVQRVPQLCTRLGIRLPSYQIKPISQGSPMCDGYADFNGDPLIEGRVGEVKNIFGKKNAREEIARIVCSFLNDIERQRREQFGLSYEEDDKKRKRSVDSSQEEMSRNVKVHQA